MLLNRPIQLLYPLEVRASEPVSEVNPYTNDVHNVPSLPESETGQDSTDPPRRTQRAAAQRADASRKACMIELEDC